MNRNQSTENDNHKTRADEAFDDSDLSGRAFGVANEDDGDDEREEEEDDGVDVIDLELDDLLDIEPDDSRY